MPNDLRDIRKTLKGNTTSLSAIQNWMQTHEIEDNTRHTENLDRFEKLDQRYDGMTETLKGIQTALEAHTEMLKDLKPLLQAAAGGKLLYKAFTIIGGLAVGWIALRQTLGI